MKTPQMLNPGRVRHRLLLTSVAVMGLLATACPLMADSDEDDRLPALPSPLCDRLQVASGNELEFHVYALGYQIYEWDGAKWGFVAPQADLFADPGYHKRVGTHFAGPTWRSKSGSEVVGVRVNACTPDPLSIPWLLLAGASSHGPGVFNGVTFIQRVNTVGGLAPAVAGSTPGERMAVPYTAEYFFYKADPDSIENQGP